MSQNSVVPKFAPELVSHAVVGIGQPFEPALSYAPALPARTDWKTPVLFCIWLTGFGGLALLRLRAWLRIRAPVRCSIPMGIGSHLVRSSPALIEPGVVGWFHPIVLLPDGILNRLTSSQMDAVLAHEFCHIRRRDNLIAAIHMITESVFWFHPLVWWISARLLEERERACDEEVLRLGTAPGSYAQAILNVCRWYVESPLACLSGIAGSNLRKRIEAIVNNEIAPALNIRKRFLLAMAGLLAVAGPLVIGIIDAPLKLSGQSISMFDQTQGTNSRLKLLL